MSRNEQDLLLRIRGDSKEAVKSVDQIRASIASLKERIKEIKAESAGEVGFKKERIAAHQASLKELTNEYKKLTQSQKDAKKSTEEVTEALTLISPRAGAVANVFTGATGPVVALTAAFVGLQAVGIGIQKGLFDLARSAADFRGKLLDMSQQTGVSVETLSALEVAAARVGTSIEGIVAPLGIFQRHLEEAQDPSSKMAERFKELGVETENTEDALRQTLAALAAMPEGFRQTSQALELFGRGGRTFLAILKETDGDLDAVIDKLRDLGVVVSREDAEAADKFNDELALLQFQMRALLGNEVIPAATKALQDISRVFKDNKEAVSAVGSALGSLSSVLGNVFTFQLIQLSGAITSVNRALENQASLWQTIALAIGVISRDIPKIPVLDPTGGAGAFNFQPGNVGGGRDAQSALAVHQPQGEIDRALRAGRAVRSAADPSVAFMAQLAEEVKKLTDSLNGLDTSTRRYRVEQEIANGALKNAGPLTQRLARAQADQLDGSSKLAASVKIITEFQKAQNEQVRLLLQGEKNAIQVANEFIASLEKQGVVLSDSIRSFIEFNARILVSVGSVRELVKAFDEFQLPEFGKLEGFGVEGKNILDPLLFENDPIPKLKQIHAGIEAMRDAFSELGGAVGSVIHNFVLFGSAGTSFRKFTAEVLAGVAAQAAVKAIFELAEGFAMLFLNPPAAAAHFKAAALYGAVAGAAAVAGRAVAGNAFQSQGAGAGGGGSTSSGPLQTIIQPRNQRQSIEIRVVDGELGPRIVAHVVKDYSEGGSTREVILNDGV